MTANSAKRVAIYARVSTNDQTTENQLPDLRRYAHERGWIVSGEYVDQGISGAKQGRPALDRMMLHGRKRQFDVVLVWRFDRFARSTSHLLNSLDEFRQLGVDFCSLNEAIDTSTPMGKMIFTVCAAVAELERGIIIERVHAGIRRARNEGKQLGRPKTTVQPDEVFRLRGEGLSLRLIAKRLGTAKSTVADILKASAVLSEKPLQESFL
jgi:DNA invertase Pin-like site-specific DNA recombinase